MRSKILNAILEGIKQSFMIDPKLNDEDFVKSKISKSEDFVPYDYRFVDLGLSVKWAEYNLGAYPGNSPESWYGDYYAWGEIEPKINYNWDNYKFKNPPIKYNEKDGLELLLSEDDVVILTLGDMYRMPTLEEIKELCDIRKVSNELIKNYKNIPGLNGRLFISKIPGFEGKELFIPAAGHFDNSVHRYIGFSGSVWSSSIDLSKPQNAYYISFYATIHPNNDYRIRYRGCSVRPVQIK